METAFRKSFTKDIRKIKDRTVLEGVQHVIEEVSAASQLADVPNVKKLAGASNAYRIRVGDHRIGVLLEASTVEFVRCLHRRDLYRYFP